MNKKTKRQVRKIARKVVADCEVGIRWAAREEAQRVVNEFDALFALPKDDD